MLQSNYLAILVILLVNIKAHSGLESDKVSRLSTVINTAKLKTSTSLNASETSGSESEPSINNGKLIYYALLSSLIENNATREKIYST